MVIANLLPFSPFLITTLGIFELSVMYSPDSETFRMTDVGNSREAMQEAQFNSKVPLNELPKIPRQAYVSQEFLQYEGSGGPNDTKITDKVYMFVNKTSGRLSAVKNMCDASKITIDDRVGSGDGFLVGDCYEFFKNRRKRDSADKKCPTLFKGVIPYLTTQENQTVLDFERSYITTENVQSTDMFAVVLLFGRHPNENSC